MDTINFLKIKTNMIFKFENGYEILFNSLLLNDENPYWEKWLNEQKEPTYVYNCPGHWNAVSMEWILVCYARIKNVLIPNYSTKIPLYAFDNICDIAYDINDMIIKRKIYAFIKLIRQEKNTYTCHFLSDMMDGKVQKTNEIKLDNLCNDYAERLINMVIKYKINETELMEFLLYVEPSLAKKCNVPMTADLFERIMSWKS